MDERSGQAKFHDHFSERASGYAIYRPTYPPELVDFLFDLTSKESDRETSVSRSGSTPTVWEAGCGSGQLTGALAQRFSRIVATDASPEQIAQARPLPEVEFRVARAEASGLPDQSVDLAIAAQAAHWFDLENYYAEVRRVVSLGGYIALITYGIHVTDDVRIDRIIKHLYHETLAGYWAPERRLVEEGYRGMPFPFAEISTPAFEMQAEWSLAEMLGYVETWSAVGALIKAMGRPPIDAFRHEISAAWSDPRSTQVIRWPLSLRLGRI
jgi:SAM-dependent methyltransferase